MHLIRNSISMMTNMIRLFALTIILLCMMAQQGLAADTIALSLVLDHSGSMDNNDPDDIRIASAKLCADLMESGSDWGAVVGFDDSADVQIVMTRDMSALKNGITKTGYGAGTNFYDALSTATDTLNSAAISGISGSRKAVIFFTDGKDSYDTSVLDTFVQNSWRIYCIGFGSVDDSVLQNIADTTGGLYYRVSTANMQEVMPTVLADIRGESPPEMDEAELSQGEHVSQSYYVPSNQVLDWIKFTTIWEYGSEIDFYVVSPSNVTYQNDFSGTNYGVYTINNPESGTWSIHMVGTNAADGTISVDYGTSFELSDYGQIQVNASPSGSQCKLSSSGTWYSTPHLYQNISPGTYTIYCTKGGYTQKSKTVTLSAGELESVSFSLIQETGTIQVASEQSATQCRLGSSGSWYNTPHTYSGVTTGSYTIYAQKTDYHTASKSITLSSNETESVYFDLQPVGDIGISFPTLNYNWEYGVEQTITFTSGGVNNVMVELYKGDSLVEVISNSLSASTEYIAYTPSSNLTTGIDYNIKITSLENGDIYGWTPDFRIILKTIQIGGLTIESDGIWKATTGSDTWLANGNTTINDIVSVDAELTIDLNTLSLSGDCELSIGPLAGNIVPQTQIWNGEFAFNVTDTLLELGQEFMDLGNDVLALAGCPLQLYEFEFVEKNARMGVEIKGKLVLPDEWGGLAIDFGSQGQHLRIDKNGIGFSGSIAVPDVQFATWGIKDTVLSFNYWDEITQTRLDFFSAETMINFPAKFGLEAALDIREAKIDRIGFGVDANDPGIQILPPLPQPGVIYFQKAYGEAYNLSNPEPWGVRLGKEDIGELIPEGLVLTAGPEFKGYYALKAKFGLDINSGGYMWGNGDLYVFNDDFNIAGGDIYLNKDYGAYLGGWVTWDYELFRLDSEAKIMLDLFDILRGQVTGKMTMNWPWDDFASVTSGSFIKISEIDTDDIPDKYVMAWVDVAGSEICALYNFATEEATTPSNMELVEEITFPATQSKVTLAKSLLPSEMAIATPDLTLAGQYVFILKSTRDIIGFELEKPDNVTRVTSVTAGEQYLIHPGKGALYVVDVPQEDLGEWKMVTSNTFNTAGASIEVRRVLPLPQLDSVHVSSVGSNSYQINWEDYDPAKGLITVLCSIDGTVVNSVQIATLDASNSNNSVIWSTEEVASGKYTIIVLLEQNGQIPVSAKAPDLVQIIDSEASGTPTNLSIDGAGGVITVWWEPVTDAAGYTVEYRDLLAMEMWPSFDIVDANDSEIILTGLAAGRTYQVRVRSFNVDTANSPWAGWYDIKVEAVQGVNSPPAIEGGFAPMAQSGELYEGTLLVSDADNDVVSFTLQDGPTGFALATYGHYSWTPDDTHIGWQTLTIVADDGNSDGTATYTMNILVAHQSASNESVCDGAGFVNLGDLVIETWGEPFSYTFEVDSCFDAQTAIFAEGLPDGATLVDNGNGTATFTWNPEQADIGDHDNIQITVSDGYSQTSQIISITVKDLHASISEPQAESRVGGVIDIYGTCSADADFASGVLEFRPEYGSYTFVTFISTAVAEGVLYEGFDTTGYPDGNYEFRIKAYDYENNYAEYVQRFIIDNTPAELVDGLFIETLEGSSHTCMNDSELYVRGEMNENARVYDYRYVNLEGEIVEANTLRQFQYSANLNNARYAHSSVTVDGKIYVIGGSGNSGTVITEMYDTAKSTQGWQLLSDSLNIGSTYHSSVAIDSKIYIISTSGDSSPGPVKVYDTAEPTLGWQSLNDDLNRGWYSLSSVTIDSKIYVIGGGNGWTSGLEVYDTANPSQGWSLSSNSLTIQRYRHSSVVIDGKIYVIGGEKGGLPRTVYSSVEVYDTANPSLGWQLLGDSLNNARFAHTSIAIDGKIYVIGGRNTGNYGVSSIEVYDTAEPSQGWQILSDQLNANRSYHSSVTINGKIYVIGGWCESLSCIGSNYVSSTEILTFPSFQQNNLILSGDISSYFTTSGDTFRLEIQLIDEAGNISDWIPSNYMVIDTTPPEVVISRPSENANVDGSSGFINISGVIFDDLNKPTKVQWSKNGTDWTDCSLSLNWQDSTWNAQVPVLGYQTTILVKGFDSAGNESTPVSVTVSHYADFPIAELTTPSGNVFHGTAPITIAGNVYNVSGHTGFSWSLQISEGDGSSGVWENLVENSTTGTINNTLHNWPAPVDSNQYTIKLTATNDYGSIATTQPFFYSTTEFIDNDEDGLPDNWEIFKLGYLFYDGDDDNDGDGIPNIAEYLNGTNPVFMSGDVSGDALVDLSDLIISLQFLTGKEVNLTTNGDCNGDLKIGLEDSISIMQTIGTP